MRPFTKRDLVDGVRRRLRKLFDVRVVRWYRLGESQQSWYLRRLFRLLDIDLVLDVGGNEGQFVRFIRRKVGYRGPIVTFEPIPELAEALRRRAVRDPHWTVVQAALGDVAKEAVFNVMRSSPLSSLLAPSENDTQRLAMHNSVSRQIPVEVQTLDSFFTANPAMAKSRSVYLKIDVQGYERRVIEGAQDSLAQVAALQVELSVIPLYEGTPRYADLLCFIEERDYLLSFIPAHNYEQFPDMIDFDCHFVRRAFLENIGVLPASRD